ncbi:Heat shock protein 70 family [Macleaya cordata]|uniref:Heat shock protein 70 family n=1 Tax=Macleaya cordata TaxID=56857 RepID=A0A200QWP4_MACCD|nr:Heat shock protein 70 family [Macleaya cordata]
MKKSAMVVRDCGVIFMLSLVIFCFSLVKASNGLGTVIGIDFGTSYSSVGVFRNDKVEIIPNELGNRITPSWVTFTNTKRLVGEAAMDQASLNAAGTVFSVKDFLGVPFEVLGRGHHLHSKPYEVVDKDGKPYIRVKLRNGKTKELSPEEISGMILRKMKETAEAYLGQKIKNAVISVPAHYDYAERQAIMDAGTIAGLNVVRLINDPTATAIAYGFDKKVRQKILVVDVGGGTTEASILTINKGSFQVLGTTGLVVGGDSFTWEMMIEFIYMIRGKFLDVRDNPNNPYFGFKWMKDMAEDILNMTKNMRITKPNGDLDNEAMLILWSACEMAKRTLSSRQEVKVEMSTLFKVNSFTVTYSRDDLEKANTHLFEAIMKTIKDLLDNAGLKQRNIDEIVLVGGSTRIPKVQQLLKEMFYGKRPYRGLNRDEVVAYGAAILGGVLSGEGSQNKIKDIRLLDGAQSHLMAKVIEPVVVQVIPKNTVIPTMRSMTVTTTNYEETSAVIKVYERKSIHYDEKFALKQTVHELGSFRLYGIPPTGEGHVKIEVTFDIDENGILNVMVKDKATKISQAINITRDDKSRLLSREEIERLAKEEEKLVEEETKIGAWIKLLMYVNSIKNIMISNKDKVPEEIQSDEKLKIESALKETHEWMEENQQKAQKEDFEMRLKELQALMNSVLNKVHEENPEHDEL